MISTDDRCLPVSRHGRAMRAIAIVMVVALIVVGMTVLFVGVPDTRWDIPPAGELFALGR